jgi:hypothetical protein
MLHEHIRDDRPEPRVGMDRRRSGWMLWTGFAVIVLAALVISVPMFKGADPVDSAVPGPDRETVGTTGETPVDEAVPGATAGPSAEDDFAFFPGGDNLKPNTIVAHMDRQPLYLVDATPVDMRDNEMIVEEVANEENKRAANYMLYVPSASANHEDDAAQFYYLKVDEDKFLKVSLTPPQTR